MTEGPLDVTVVCVTYHSRDLAPTALRSAKDACVVAGLRAELIAVDNASGDGTADALAAAIPEAMVIRNSENVGFGAANNQAFEIARGRWWLLLNPDASLEPDAVRLLIRAISADGQLAMAGPSVSGAGVGGAESAGMLPGIRSLAGHFLFINRLLPRGRGGPWRGFQVRPWEAWERQEVEWISAAAAVLRPDAVRALGGFNPAIFLYGEDLDLCSRMIQSGWHLALLTGARATHTIGGSQGPGSTRWLDGLNSFLARHGAPRWRRSLCLAIVGIGLALRAAAALVGSGDEASVAHRRRMRAGALRALAIAITDSTPPSHGVRHS